MQTSAEMTAACTPAELFAYVADLDTYPQWLGGLVHAVDREVASEVDTPVGVGAPAWRVELRGRLGPIARSKTLRMVRTEFVPDRVAMFERAETDGRHHAAWRLRAEVSPDAGEVQGSRLVMTLTYEGSLWTGGVLERVLRDQIEAGRDRLSEILSEPTR